MLFRKMLRDMKINLSQFVSIFIMSILGVLVYSGINAEWYGMKSEVDKYYQETSLADIWVMSNHFDTSDIDKVKKLSGISDAALRLTLDASVSSNNEQTLRINVINDNKISTPKLVEGNAFSEKEDGLWLDDSFAKANNLKVGSKITFEIMGMKLEKTVLGLIMHPEYVHNVKDDSSMMPSPKTFGFAFLYHSAFPDKLTIPYNQLLIVKNTDSSGKINTDNLENIFSDRYSMIIDRATHPSVSAFESEIQQNKAMGGVFPVVFFLIAALTMLTTMTRMISNQRTQIGTLKALGFSKHKILGHYVSYGLWIGLVGGILGLFTGPLLIPPILFNMQKTLYIIPNWRAAISPTSFVSVAVAVLCCGASSYFACRHQLKEVPAAALRPCAPNASRHSSIEKRRLWHSFGFSVQWNLRDVLRSRIRSIMTIIGVMGCTALLLFGLGLRDTINGISNWMYKDLNIYESKISLKEDITKEAMDKLSNKYMGQWVQEANIELKNGNQKESGSLTVLDKGENVKFENEHRQGITLPDNGIGLSYKMAEILNIHAGDIVKWRIYGEKEWQESKVNVIYRTPMGQGISMKKGEYQKTEHKFQPTALLTTDKAEGADKLQGVNNIQHKGELTATFDKMLDSMRMIIVILVLAAVILGSVVLYNLGALSFTERVRELATLKVLGFFPKQIRSLLQMQNVWLTAAGIVIGIPIGYTLIQFMLSTMPDSLDMMSDVSVISLLISIAGTFAVSTLISLLLSKKVKNIDMITSLKSIE